VSDFSLEDLADMSPEDQVKTRESLAMLLKGLDSKRADRRDNEQVWVRNPAGLTNPVTRGYWRTYLQKQDGWEMLDVNEVKDEQAKVAQSAALRASKQEHWELLTMDEQQKFGSVSDADLRTLQATTLGRDKYDGMSASEMAAKLADLQNELEDQKKKK
tara:strand:- start:121 stop:597 length:477 start_codon:yes stop_codon:yes gene_type:complete